MLVLSEGVRCRWLVGAVLRSYAVGVGVACGVRSCGVWACCRAVACSRSVCAVVLSKNALKVVRAVDVYDVGRVAVAVAVLSSCALLLAQGLTIAKVGAQAVKAKNALKLDAGRVGARSERGRFCQ